MNKETNEFKEGEPVQPLITQKLIDISDMWDGLRLLKLHFPYKDP